MDECIEPFIQDTLKFSTQQLEDQALKSGHSIFLHSLATFTKDRKGNDSINPRVKTKDFDRNSDP